MADTAMLCKPSVVWTNLRRQTGRKPFSRIKVRTLWRPMAWPRSAINVVSLRLPCVVGLVAGYKGGLKGDAGRAHYGCRQALLARGTF